MDDREFAKQIVADVFNKDLKGDIGRMARFGVSKEDKRDIVDRVHRLIGCIREDERAKVHQGAGRPKAPA